MEKSDVTIVFTFGRPTGGSAYTMEVAEAAGKPVLHVDLDSDDDRFVEEIRSFLAKHDVNVLNVAGSRESTAPGIFEEVRRLLLAALSEGHRACV